MTTESGNQVEVRYITLGVIVWILAVISIVLVMNFFEQKPATEKTTYKSIELTKQWVVQVASFSGNTALKKLDTSLTKKGYKTHIIFSINKQGKSINAIRLGPYSSKEQAKKIKQKVAKSFKVSPQIILLTTSKP